MEIHELQADQIQHLAEWLPETELLRRYGSTTQAMHTALEKALDDDDLLLVATHHAKSSEAYGLAWCMYKGAFGISPYLRLLMVHPEYVGQGMGGRLMSEAETRLSQTSDALFLLTSDFNDAAHAFYSGRGYVQIGEIPGYVLPNVKECIFWKRLSRV